MKKWTNSYIKSLPKKNKRYTQQQDNLIIRVQPSGNKSWFAYGGRGKPIFLGSFHEMSLKEAKLKKIETETNIKRPSKLMKKYNIAILGSGNIGTDLLIKSLRSEYLNCVGFVGRSINSNGMKKAMNLEVRCSDQSIQFILDNSEEIDLVFDATSAKDHMKHAPMLLEKGIRAIDLTPAKVGKMAVPAVNIEDCKDEMNINMITCGGQASIPIAYAIGKTHKDIEYIEVVSSISSKSAGPATRLNLDEYIATTEEGLKKFSGAKKTKAILNLNPAVPCINMQTTIFAKTDSLDINALNKELKPIVKKIKEYVPGYELLVEPLYENGRTIVMVRVKGLGDYLPEYAGNLDIINCAAIAMAEEYAKSETRI
jgi:acetaldehyde dehydrogenase